MKRSRYFPKTVRISVNFKLEQPGKLADLLHRYLENKITLEEAEALMKSFDTDDQYVLDQLIVSYLDKDLSSAESLAATLPPAHVFEGIRNRIKPVPRTKKLWPALFGQWRRPIAAAAAVAAITLSVWFYNSYYAKVRSESTNTSYVNDISPGSSGATLTLANGKKIRLNGAANGELAKEAGISIKKTANGELVYELTAQTGATKQAHLFNTLTTANGETFQVKLPDGSRVWLNAASSLTYPASFAELGKRSVNLQGEAYFQVAKDKLHPFIVKTESQEVEVLGTEFNINSYADERMIRTTLLEGAIKITGQNDVVKILKPNQQALNSPAGIQIVNVESQFFVDWKEGFFMFNNESLESILRRVSRWYNVKLVYKDPGLKKQVISGTISKYEHISGLLKVLEKSGIAEFSVEHNILTISEKD